MGIELRCIHDADIREGEFRVLVDRLWPRGISKERAALDLWAKDVSPSPDLRKAWHAAPEEQWDAFADAYRAELDGSPALAAFRAELARHESVALLYAKNDPERNHARVLLEFL